MNGQSGSTENQDLCTCCREIFYGQLKSENSRSIRVDCRRDTSMSTLTPGANIRDVGGGEDANSLDTPNLPGTLYVHGYKYIHMSTGYEDTGSSDEDMLEDVEPFEHRGIGNPESELEPPWKRYGTHHQTVSAFKLAVHDGCRICKEIRLQVSNISWTDLERAETYDSGFTTYGIYYFPKNASFWIIFYVGLSASHPGLCFDPQQTALHLICQPREYFDRNFKAISGVRTRARSSTSSANFRIMLQWIQHCNKHHTCRVAKSDASECLPARLLKIGQDLDSQIRLINTNDTKLQAPYATLSYCWGSGLPVKLTSSSLSAFERSIWVAALPKTLRDAVIVARQIGVNYLWIDALCIIQDSSDDWEKEARKMAEIYSRSYCNIAATHTRSCDDGLFTINDYGKSAVICVDTRWDGVDIYRLGLVDYEFVIKKLERAPLNSRGWVLQERFLSPRTIHFGDDQVLWECYGGYKCEAFPFGPIFGMATDFAKRRLSNQPECTRPYSNTDEAYALWGHLVGKFCSCKLTFPRDKLIAISGLARKFQSAMNDEYIAGLWWNQLPAQLAWTGEKTIKPLQYRAPSWSWASLEGMISIHRLQADILGLINPIEYNIEYATEDKYGEVTSGSIRVSGKLFPHILTPYQDGFIWQMIFYDEDLNSGPYARPAVMDISSDYSNVEYYCLPVLLEKSCPAHVVNCLILQATENAQGEYSRIGRFSTHYKEDVDIMTERSESYEMDPDLYDAHSTITII